MSLKNGDLVGTILPEVSIDQFEPKSGNENNVIVVAFYLTDEGPAEDLNTFIQRGFIDTLDVEVSPNTDEEGRYLVFVEMSRDESFVNKFTALMKDIENVAGKHDWKVETYFSDGKAFNYNDPELFNYVIVDPTQYVPKEEFNVENKKKKIKEFFNHSYAANLTVNGDIVTIANNRHKVMMEVVDVGDYDTVIGRNFLSESAFGVGKNPYVGQILQSILGTCQILPLDKYLCVNNGDQVLLIKNTQLF